MAGRILREDILAAAMSILDRGGLPALAMRRIAGELEVQQSALYWHFRNKQELLAALADRILEDTRPPTSDRWPDRVAELAVSLRAALLEHQDGADLVATAYSFGLGAEAASSRFLDELAHAGLTPADAATAASVLLHFVLGYTTGEQQHHQAATLHAIESDRTPHRRAPFGSEDFQRGVQLIISGIEPLAGPG